MSDNRREKGIALFREIYGDAAADGLSANIEAGSAFGIEQSRWTAEFVFGEVWSREALDRRTRSAAVLGMLIAQGRPEEIRYHTRMGMKNGLTPTEIEEIFYSSIPYCGFPHANVAKVAMLAGFKDAEEADSS